MRLLWYVHITEAKSDITMRVFKNNGVYRAYWLFHANKEKRWHQKPGSWFFTSANAEWFLIEAVLGIITIAASLIGAYSVRSNLVR